MSRYFVLFFLNSVIFSLTECSIVYDSLLLKINQYSVTPQSRIACLDKTRLFTSKPISKTVCSSFQFAKLIKFSNKKQILILQVGNHQPFKASCGNKRLFCTGYIRYHLSFLQLLFNDCQRNVIRDNFTDCQYLFLLYLFDNYFTTIHLLRYLIIMNTERKIIGPLYLFQTYFILSCAQLLVGFCCLI